MQVTCLTSTGFGNDLEVTLLTSTLYAPLSGQSRQALVTSDCVYSVSNDSVVFSYEEPIIYSVWPRHGPTAGGSRVTIAGVGFGGGGVSPVVSVSAVLPGGSRETSLALHVVSYNNTAIVADMPGAAGANLSIVVVHGTSGARAVASGVWSYDAAVVYGLIPRGNASAAMVANTSMPCNGYNLSEVDSHSWNSSACVEVWYPATGGVVDIYGVNFGFDVLFSGVGNPSVMIGELPCVPLAGKSLFVSDSQLTCETAETAVGNKTMSVNIGGQVGSVSAIVSLRAQCGPGYLGHDGEWMRSLLPC